MPSRSGSSAGGSASTRKTTLSSMAISSAGTSSRASSTIASNCSSVSGCTGPDASPELRADRGGGAVAREPRRGAPAGGQVASLRRRRPMSVRIDQVPPAMTAASSLDQVLSDRYGRCAGHHRRRRRTPSAGCSNETVSAPSLKTAPRLAQVRRGLLEPYYRADRDKRLPCSGPAGVRPARQHARYWPDGARSPLQDRPATGAASACSPGPSEWRRSLRRAAGTSGGTWVSAAGSAAAVASWPDGVRGAWAAASSAGVTGSTRSSK